VVDHLKRGLPYREIHRLTGVSVTTIGRVARFVGRGNGGYEVAAQRLEEAKREPVAKRPESSRRVVDDSRNNVTTGVDGGRHG
jgi:hypothetical protein